MPRGLNLSPVLIPILFARFVEQAAALRQPSVAINASIDLNFLPWTYRIPNKVQNRASHARFDIQTPSKTLSPETLLSLDAPQIDVVNASVFDWWYFDAVSDVDPGDSLVVTFFTSSVVAFPFLSADESSVLIAYLWASFANGTVYADFIPATVATVVGGTSNVSSTGQWAPTGFSWASHQSNLSQYEITISSKEMQVKGRFTLTSVGDAIACTISRHISGIDTARQRAPIHLPCGIQEGITTLEIAPHIGWANLVPDATGMVDLTIHGSPLRFQGPGYHDKNWSDRPFMESVQSWYWGHGRLGPYSLVWFSYLALNDPTNTTYMSSYVAKDGQAIVSSCDISPFAVYPVGSAGTTGGRYPPHVGDVPEGFRLQFDLGTEGLLKVNVFVGTVVAGDGEYYMRWTGNMTGKIVKNESRLQDACAAGGTNTIPVSQPSLFAGVAVFEQFALVE
ncbi:Hydroxyneurosporene synthase [Penicillium lagena]|uniref:Hydroxyneurosporene synthase n=1 Tax=Penicillium lagena TaxID=94218 RepID=UPI0025400590|nr:Hydroxyneurosporene synthase [Penicillium lagena]KAJ5612090.1 Hydroxyneurosporene synthase [Penicillium lagena]